MRPSPGVFTLFLQLAIWSESTHALNQIFGPLSYGPSPAKPVTSSAHDASSSSDNGPNTTQSTGGRETRPVTKEGTRESEVRTIALVGNGRSLLVSSRGELIDGHDLVGRFNFFRIDGFEDKVGQRTDLWFLNQ
eukprot:289649-Pyramimonas_sp.AAC.1